MEIKKQPNDKWKTPLNFETHEKYFGPGPKTECIDDLKGKLDEMLAAGFRISTTPLRSLSRSLNRMASSRHRRR